MSSAAPLSYEVIDAALADSPWKREGDVMVLIKTCGSFPESLGFVVAVGAIAESLDHHPDISIAYTKVTLRVSTHDAGALTEKDLELAARVDNLA